MFNINPPLFGSFKRESMHTWSHEVNDGEESDLCRVLIHSKRRRAAECAAALRSQTQEEASDKPAGHYDVPFDKICGLREKESETSDEFKRGAQY